MTDRTYYRCPICHWTCAHCADLGIHLENHHGQGIIFDLSLGYWCCCGEYHHTGGSLLHHLGNLRAEAADEHGALICLGFDFAAVRSERSKALTSSQT